METLVKLKDLPEDLRWICDKCISPYRHITPIGCQYRDYNNDLCPNLSRLINRLNDSEKKKNGHIMEV